MAALSAAEFFTAIILHENNLHFPIQITFFCRQSAARKEIFGILSTALLTASLVKSIK